MVFSLLLFLVLISVLYANECNHAMDIVWVLDESGSIGNKRYKVLKEFVIDVTSDAVFDNTRFGLIEFGTPIGSVINLESDKDIFSSHVDGIKYSGGNTYTYRAVKYLNENFFVDSANAHIGNKRVIIFATDGKPNPGKQGGKKLIAEVDQLFTDSDVERFVFLRLGKNVNDDLFDDAAGFNNTRDLFSSEFDQLSGIVELFADKVACETDIVGVPTTGPTVPTASPTGYPTPFPTSPIAGPTPPPTSYLTPFPTVPTASPTQYPTLPVRAKRYKECDNKHVLFALDESHSIGGSEMERQKEMLLDIVNNMNISEPGAHVAAVSFAGRYNDLISLDKINRRGGTDGSNVRRIFEKYIAKPHNTKSWTNFITLFDEYGPTLGSVAPNASIVVISDGRPYVPKLRGGTDAIDKACNAREKLRQQYPGIKLFCYQTIRFSKPTKFFKCACDVVWTQGYRDNSVSKQVLNNVCGINSPKLKNPCVDKIKQVPCGRVRRNHNGKRTTNRMNKLRHCRWLPNKKKCIVKPQFRILYN